MLLAIIAFVQVTTAVIDKDGTPSKIVYGTAALPMLSHGMVKGSGISPGCRDAEVVTCQVAGNKEQDDTDKEGIKVFHAGKSEKITVTWPSREEAIADANITGVIAMAKVKLCFTKESLIDRPWRKFKDDVEKNKQCVPKAIDTLDWSLDSGLPNSKTWTIKSMVPRCTAYLRVFALDKDDNYLLYGDTDIFQINGYDGLTPGITIGSIILSIVSIGILGGYFLYTIMKKDA